MSDLPLGWAWVNLEELAVIGTGTTPNRGNPNYWTNGSIPWIKSTAVNQSMVTHAEEFVSNAALKETTLRVYPRHTLILALYGEGKTRGKVSELGIDATINQALAAIQVHGIAVDCRPFLKAFLDSNYVKLRRQAAGGMQPNLNLGLVKKIRVPLAPLSEQLRIVAKIDELFSDLDAGVATLERVRANLKRYRAAVLKAAVEGKLTEDWRAKHPDTEPTSVLLERILTERRRQWEKDQLAKFAQAGKQPPKGWQEKYPDPRQPETTNTVELPNCWCSVSLDQLVGRSEYGTSVKCDYAATGPPVLRIPNIARGDLDLKDIKNTTIPMEITPGDELQKGDMLVCRTNGSISLIGKAALVRTALRPPHTFASYLLRFRFIETEFLPKWAHIFFSSLQGRSFIEGYAASSAGQHNVSLSLLNGMPLPLPPRDEQEVIVSEVESRLSILDEIEAQVDANLKRAARLRQGILKRAFEGGLVPQDPTDEPAEKLLERIRQQRQPATTMYNGRMGTRRARRPRRTSDPLLPFPQDDGNG